MSRHEATVEWRRLTPDFDTRTYDRGHWLAFPGEIRVPGTAARNNIPATAPHSPGIDPEQAFVAALSSCHMLWFLYFASVGKLVVDRYLDHATGVLEPNGEGKLAITRVTLKPTVTFSGTPPSEQEIRALHEKAHDKCFIANSVRTAVVVEPEFE
jgi:organic hydroperoxide reductase OsmC/OhrA